MKLKAHFSANSKGDQTGWVADEHAREEDEGKSEEEGGQTGGEEAVRSGRGPAGQSLRRRAEAAAAEEISGTEHTILPQQRPNVPLTKVSQLCSYSDFKIWTVSIITDVLHKRKF